MIETFVTSRVVENRGARERRSYEVRNLVRSVSQYQKKLRLLRLHYVLPVYHIIHIVHTYVSMLATVKLDPSTIRHDLDFRGEWRWPSLRSFKGEVTRFVYSY